jgi:ribosomal protein S18 acetylase RimI-like enzyme
VKSSLTAATLPSALVRSVLRLGTGGITVLRSKGRSLRVTPWRAGQSVAQVAPLGEPPDAETLLACCGELAAMGFREVLTSALAPAEQRAFRAAGFETRADLVLLRIDLRRPLPALRTGEVSIRRARRGEWTSIAALDERAFSSFWHFDVGALGEAVRATPSHRFRVAELESLAGYAIAGRSGIRGYIQRLAVDPWAAGRGVGSTLLLDVLHWLRGGGSQDALVNTMVGNDRALHLYLRHGFEQVPGGLAVLGRVVT